MLTCFWRHLQLIKFKMVDLEERILADPSQYRIIADLFDTEDQESYEIELDAALEDAVQTIIIEPPKLGDETYNWIRIGNCLHKTSVLSGFGCLVVGCFYPKATYVIYPLAGLSAICAGLYAISWQFDPCCKYQVESNTAKLERLGLPLNDLNTNSPVVLVRRDDGRRKILQNTIALASSAYCIWRLYHTYWS